MFFFLLNFAVNFLLLSFKYQKEVANKYKTVCSAIYSFILKFPHFVVDLIHDYLKYIKRQAKSSYGNGRSGGGPRGQFFSQSALTV